MSEGTQSTGHPHTFHDITRRLPPCTGITEKTCSSVTGIFRRKPLVWACSPDPLLPTKNKPNNCKVPTWRTAPSSTATFQPHNNPSKQPVSNQPFAVLVICFVKGKVQWASDRNVWEGQESSDKLFVAFQFSFVIVLLSWENTYRFRRFFPKSLPSTQDLVSPVLPPCVPFEFFAWQCAEKRKFAVRANVDTIFTLTTIVAVCIGCGLSAHVKGQKPILSETQQTFLNVQWVCLAVKVVAYCFHPGQGQTLLARVCAPHPKTMFQGAL